MAVKPHSDDDPLYRAKVELLCLGRTLMPDKDSVERTIATVILFIVWATIVIAPMLVPETDPPPWELHIGITAVVFLVLGRMWDIEVERVLDGVTISTDGGQRSDDNEDS